MRENMTKNTNLTKFLFIFGLLFQCCEYSTKQTHRSCGESFVSHFAFANVIRSAFLGKVREYLLKTKSIILFEF